MNLKSVLEKLSIKTINVKSEHLEVEFDLQDDDKIAAWEMYIELVTRITTQALPDDVGVEQIALDSVYSLFGVTRSILKEKGRKAKNFSRIAIIVLNVVIRPFTAKWHKIGVENKLEISCYKKSFRKDLTVLQKKLRIYASILAAIAEVEDFTDIGDLI